MTQEEMMQKLIEQNEKLLEKEDSAPKKDSALMIKKKSTKTRVVKEWERLFNECNPMDADDFAVIKAKETKLPNASYVTSSQRGQKMDELESRALEHWATRNPDDVRAWTINIPAQIVMTTRQIKEWIEEGVDEDRIESILKSEENEDERYLNAKNLNGLI